VTRPALDARVRLAAAVAAWSVAFGAPRPVTVLGVAAIALLFRLLRPRPLPALLPSAGVAILAAGLLSVSGGATAAGPLFARIVAAGWIGAALVAWLPLSELLGTLHWIRVPTSLLEIVAIGDRQRHALADHAFAVRDAQRLRLGWTGLRRALRSAGSLGGLVLWRAVTQAEVASDALALRGARGRLHHPLEPRPGWRNVLFAAGAAAALYLCVLLP
jgi:cobalt/nickel transport system permease protein